MDSTSMKRGFLALSVAPSCLAFASPWLTQEAVQDKLRLREVRTYRLRVQAGECIRIVADQVDVDLRLRLLDHSGKMLRTIDAFGHGEESLTWIGRGQTPLVVEVSGSSGAAYRGRFRILVSERRPASSTDGDQMDAETISTRVRELHRKGTEEGTRESLTLAESAVKAWQNLRQRPSVIRSSMELAGILHSMNRYEEARKHFTEALILSRSMQDHRSEAEILNNLAMGYWEQGQIDNAVEKLNASAEVWLRVEGDNGRGATFNNLGLLAWQVGKAREALGYYEIGTSSLRALGHSRGEAYVLHNKALAYATLGDYRRAEGPLRTAADSFLAEGDKLAAGRSLSARAKVLLLSGKLEGARDNVSSALSLIEPTGNRRALAQALETTAQIRLARGDLSGSLDASRSALELFRTIKDSRGEAQALRTMGTALISSRANQEALLHLAEARRIFREIGARTHEATVLCTMAMAHRDADDTKLADNMFAEAIDLIESIRAEAPGDRLRTSFLAARLSCYQEYVYLLAQQWLLHKKEDHLASAFRVLEQGRARQARDEVARQGGLSLGSGSDPLLTNQHESLRRSLSFNLEKIGQVSEQERTRLRFAIDEQLSKLDIVEDSIRRLDNRTVQLALKTTSLHEARTALVDDDSLLLEFVLGARKSYVFAIARTSSRIYELASRSEVESIVRNMIDVLNRGEYPRTLLAMLARKVLQPIRELNDARRLIIIPDGVLHSVPFAALPHPATGLPLVITHRILSLPSAAYGVEIRARSLRRARPTKQIAVVADPVYGPEDPRVNSSPASLARRDPYSRLIFSGRMANEIRRLASPSDRVVLTGFAATKAMVFRGELSDFRFVHLAAHGAVDMQHPDLSGLVFSLVNPDGSPIAGHLRLAEVYNLRLNGDVVVLSACQTAVGRQLPGEGVVALARGFLQAGASAVIASLWPTDDEATSELMKAFYARLLGSRGIQPSEALRYAQLTVRSQTRWKQPYFWGAYVLQGFEGDLP